MRTPEPQKEESYLFAETLKELRNAQNLTQTELAKIIGVNLRTLQNYELGVCLPKSPITLNRIAAYFNVPLQSLVKSDDFYRLLASEKKESGRDQDRKELYRLMQEITALFAGGQLSPSDRELFLDAMTELVRESYDR